MIHPLPVTHFIFFIIDLSDSGGGSYSAGDDKGGAHLLWLILIQKRIKKYAIVLIDMGKNRYYLVQKSNHG